MTQQQEAMGKDVPEPLTITVEGALDALQKALNEAVDLHGNPAKAFAWDVRRFFRARIPNIDSLAAAGEGAKE